MAKFYTLEEAMKAGDELAEAEIRYALLAEAFTDLPQLRSQLNSQIERAKAEIVRLRAIQSKGDKPEEKVDSGKVIAFDVNRFQKSS